MPGSTRLSGYWGLGPSFKCEIGKRRDIPKCSVLEPPDQAYGYIDAYNKGGHKYNDSDHLVEIFEGNIGRRLTWQPLPRRMGYASLRDSAL